MELRRRFTVICEKTCIGEDYPGIFGDVRFLRERDFSTGARRDSKGASGICCPGPPGKRMAIDKTAAGRGLQDILL